MQEPRQEQVLALASQISEILAAHPNSYEADTACEIAKSLTALRVKLSSFVQISNEQELEEEPVHQKYLS